MSRSIPACASELPGPLAFVSAQSVTQSGVGLDRDVRLEPVLAAGHGLVRVPCVGVHGADHPVLHHALRDPPPRTLTQAGLINELDVLAGDQGEQPDRVPGRTGRLLAERVEDGVGVADQRVDQRVAGGRVVPGDPRFAGVVVVMRPHR